MPRVSCLKSVAIARTPRVRQIEGMFDVPPSERSETRWEATLPLEECDWQIGLIVGPSGCGKSTIARELFPNSMIDGFDWPADKSIVDAFPASMGIKDVVGLLSSVGFSSPPSWLRPFRALSNGEQFRVTIARALAEKRELAVIDEFTSVVDRTVAKIGSAAIARTIRKRGYRGLGIGCREKDESSVPIPNTLHPIPSSRFVAVSCHYDIIDWLQPDWIFDPAANEFTWRFLPRANAGVGGQGSGVRQDAGISDLDRKTDPGPPAPVSCSSRPPIVLEIARVHRSAWQIFKSHHYLSTALHKSAKCFVAFVEERPAAFTAVLDGPDAQGGYWREHRTVCLPDFQGVGIGNALSEFVAALFVATGKRYCSRTSHPAMIAHRSASPVWKMTRAVSFGSKHTGKHAAFNRSAALLRLTAGFRFTGKPNLEAARMLGVVAGKGAGGQGSGVSPPIQVSLQVLTSGPPEKGLGVRGQPADPGLPASPDPRPLTPDPL